MHLSGGKPSIFPKALNIWSRAFHTRVSTTLSLFPPAVAAAVSKVILAVQVLMLLRLSVLSATLLLDFHSRVEPSVECVGKSS